MRLRERIEEELRLMQLPMHVCWLIRGRERMAIEIGSGRLDVAEPRLTTEEIVELMTETPKVAP